MLMLLTGLRLNHIIPLTARVSCKLKTNTTLIIIVMRSFLCHFFFGAQGQLHETKQAKINK